MMRAAMGLVTIVSGIASTGHEYGLNTLDAALVLYWVTVGASSPLPTLPLLLFLSPCSPLPKTDYRHRRTGMSILTSFGVPYFIFTSHRNRFETLPATLLLPIVPLVTQASVGSTFCKLLLEQTPPRTSYCLTVFIASYLQAGIGLLLAAAIITMYLQRLVLHHLPPRDVIVSSWLPVGPIGQGGFALIELVRPSPSSLPPLQLLTPLLHPPPLPSM
jgi:tellurite resistance protein TehA-like permease